MAVVPMRDLLRKPQDVFTQVEETREPVLITRNGRAVAALFPVDPEQAEHLVLATAPEYVQSRLRAENARSEGRTRSMADVARDLETRQAAAEGGEQDRPLTVGSDANAPALTEIEAFFGPRLANELADLTEERVAAVSASLLATAVESNPSRDEQDDPTLSDEVLTRVQRLNGELFGRLLQEALYRKASDRLSALKANHALALGGSIYSGFVKPSAEGVFDKLLAEEALDEATHSVRAFNNYMQVEHSGGKFSLDLYEAAIRGIGAFGRVKYDPDPAVVFGTPQTRKVS
jgi:prevent-host-death family protein